VSDKPYTLGRYVGPEQAAGLGLPAPSYETYSHPDRWYDWRWKVAYETAPYEWWVITKSFNHCMYVINQLSFYGQPTDDIPPFIVTGKTSSGFNIIVDNPAYLDIQDHNVVVRGSNNPVPHVGPHPNNKIIRSRIEHMRHLSDRFTFPLPEYPSSGRWEVGWFREVASIWNGWMHRLKVGYGVTVQ